MLLGKPVIAAIAGHAVAGGLELALWCDLRVVERSAVMGVFCRRWGVPLIDGGTIRLPRLIGHSRAMDLILTGRAVDAPEALEIGLANRLVEDGEALDAALELAGLYRDSGAARGRRTIQAGRSKPRKALYMAALTAAHRNPMFIPQYKQLIKRGKPVKVALCAIARKLLVHLNTQLKSEPAKT